MTTDEIFDKVQDIIAEQFSVDPETVTPDSALEDDLGADSVDLVDLAVTLEQEFNLPETEENVLGTIKTVSDVVDYIAKHQWCGLRPWCLRDNDRRCRTVKSPGAPKGCRSLP